MNLFAATSLDHIIPFLVFNWLWVGWCALEVPGSKKYGIQSVVALLAIFFLSIFQYVNAVVSMFLILYMLDMWRYHNRQPDIKEGGHIENVIKNIIRSYNKDQRQQGIKK